MKRFTLSIIVVILSITMVACNTKQASETQGGEKNKNDKHKIIMSHELPESFFKHEYMVKFKDIVEEKTDNRVEVEIYPAGQLFTDSEAIEALGTGAVHMTWPVSVNLENLNQEYSVVSLPFALDDDNFLKSPEYRQELTNLLSSFVEDQGIKVLGLMRTAEGIILTRDKEIKTMEDMKGLKIRSVGGQIATDLMKSFDATAIAMPATEIATSLSQGVIDGVNTSPDGWKDVVGSVAKHGLVVPNMQIFTYSIAADKAWFDSLPEDIQDLIIETINDLTGEQWQESIDLDKKYIDYTKKEFGTVHFIPEQEVGEWKKTVEPVIDNFRKQFPKAIKKFEELNEKYKYN